MRKFFMFLIPGSFIIFSACHSKEKSKMSSLPPPGTESIFPVTDFLKGQLHEIDSMPVTPLKTVTINGKIDSAWLKRDSIRIFAAPFLIPVIDSAAMSRYFSGKSFLDQTLNAVTISYDPREKLPPGLNLRRWDVYIDPQTGTVQRIYFVKENTEDSTDITTQYTWKANQWCSIRTIRQKPGTKPEIKEEKVTWDFDN